MRWHLPFFIACFSGQLALAEASELTVRNLPGYSSADTISEVRRRLQLVGRNAGSRVLFDNSTSIDHGIRDTTLFEYQHEKSIPHQKRDGITVSAGVQIICTTCYIKGKARAKLTMDGSTNATQFKNAIADSTKRPADAIKAFFHNISDAVNVTDVIYPGKLWDELRAVPPPQVDLNVNVDLPGYDLEVEFENTELYIELKLVLSSGLTYNLPLYSSKNLGVQFSEGFFFGVVFSIDLILSVENEIEISSGFHIKLDDKVVMKIALFGKEASGVQFHGGKFEFLPVTIESGNTVFRALLRLELRTGFSLGLDLPFNSSSALGEFLDIGAGVEARAYVNVAEFVTNVTAQNTPHNKREDCALQVVQDYKLAIGAAAGATAKIFGIVYGPTPATEVPIYYTTLATACITRGKSATTKAPVQPRAIRRGDSTTTTVTTVTYNATACLSPGLINCPASLQTISRNVVTKTLSTVVPSGFKVIWSSAAVTAFAASEFGKGALSMTGSSGVPKSYVPPPLTTSTGSAGGPPAGDVSNEKTGGVSNKLIIGVSVGVGVPVLCVIIGCVIFIRSHRRRKAAYKTRENSQVGVEYTTVQQVEVNVPQKADGNIR